MNKNTITLVGEDSDVRLAKSLRDEAIKAAAPDLLAALRELLAKGDSSDPLSERWDNTVERARAAIAKAEEA